MQTNVSDLVTILRTVDMNALGRQMTNLVSAISGMDQIGDLQAEITNMVAVLSGVGGLEQLGTNINRLTQSLSGSDLPYIMKSVSNTWTVVRGLGDLSGLETDIATLSAAVGGVDLPQMESDVGTVLGLVQGLGGLGALSTNVAALSQGLSGVDMAAMNRSIADTLSRVLGLETGMSRVQSAVGGIDLSAIDLSAVERVERLLGRSGSTDRNTFFGRLAQVSSQMEAMGLASSDAAKKAQSAKSEAANAASGIDELKAALQNMQGLDPQKLTAILEQVRSSLDAAQKGISEIPKGLDPAALERALADALRKFRQLAAQGGYPEFPLVTEFGRGAPSEPGKEPAKGGPPTEAGEGVDMKTIAKLSRDMEEIDSSVRLIKRLIEEKFQTPVVESRLIGVE